jgi:hypothetical protein
VSERTGLTGNFDLDLEYTPDQMPLSGIRLRTRSCRT